MNLVKKTREVLAGVIMALSCGLDWDEPMDDEIPPGKLAILQSHYYCGSSAVRRWGGDGSGKFATHKTTSKVVATPPWAAVDKPKRAWRTRLLAFDYYRRGETAAGPGGRRDGPYSTIIVCMGDRQLRRPANVQGQQQHRLCRGFR